MLDRFLEDEGGDMGVIDGFLSLESRFFFLFRMFYLFYLQVWHKGHTFESSSFIFWISCSTFSTVYKVSILCTFLDN